jgi:hypothetical protein
MVFLSATDEDIIPRLCLIPDYRLPLEAQVVEVCVVKVIEVKSVISERGL